MFSFYFLVPFISEFFAGWFGWVAIKWCLPAVLKGEVVGAHRMRLKVLLRSRSQNQKLFVGVDAENKSASPKKPRHMLIV